MLILYCVAAWILVISIRSYLKDKKISEGQSEKYKIGYVGIFEGDFISHWEVSRFEWEMDGVKCRKWGRGGTFCQIICENELLSRAGIMTHQGHDGCKPQRIAFEGEILEIGSFGHMGLCRYRVKITNNLRLLN